MVPLAGPATGPIVAGTYPWPSQPSRRFRHRRSIADMVTDDARSEPAELVELQRRGALGPAPARGRRRRRSATRRRRPGSASRCVTTQRSGSSTSVNWPRRRGRRRRCRCRRTRPSTAPSPRRAAPRSSRCARPARVASGWPAARPSRTPPCAPRCATRLGGHGRADPGASGARWSWTGAPASSVHSSSSVASVARISSPSHSTTSSSDVGVDVVGQRAVERAPRVGEVAQHQALAALEPVAAHERGERVAGLEHLAQDRLRRRLVGHPRVVLAVRRERGVEQLGERASAT